MKSRSLQILKQQNFISCLLKSTESHQNYALYTPKPISGVYAYVLCVCLRQYHHALFVYFSHSIKLVTAENGMGGLDWPSVISNKPNFQDLDLGKY